MNISQVAKLSQVSIRMLRYYEQLGLIKPLRGNNHYRSYSQQQLEQIQKIKLLHDSGLALKDLQQLLPCFDLARKQFELCAQTEQRLAQALDKITTRIGKLEQSQAMISNWLAQLKPSASVKD